MLPPRREKLQPWGTTCGMWLSKAAGSWRKGNDHGGGVIAAFGADGSKLEWPTCCEVADLFGTRVAETILASVHVRTYERKRFDRNSATHRRKRPSNYTIRP
jgi:hypothetical protein